MKNRTWTRFLVFSLAAVLALQCGLAALAKGNLRAQSGAQVYRLVNAAHEQDGRQQVYIADAGGRPVE